VGTGITVPADAGMGVDVDGVAVVVGPSVGNGVDMRGISGVGTCPHYLMVRANKLSWSTCALAVAAAKSTLVSSNSHVPS